MSFEIIKNKLTILLYGLEGGEDIEQQFYDNPDNVNLKQDDINYILFDSFSDFMENVSHKLNNIYGGDDEDDEGEEEDDEDDEGEEEEDEDEWETAIDNISWFLDIYIRLKDKLWFNWIKEISDTNKQIWDSLIILQEENELLKEENIRLKNKNKIKEDHIELQYHKEYNRQDRKKKDIELKINKTYQRESYNSRPVPQKRRTRRDDRDRAARGGRRPAAAPCASPVGTRSSSSFTGGGLFSGGSGSSSFTGGGLFGG